MVNRKDLTLLVLGEKTREELLVRSRDLVYVSHDPLQKEGEGVLPYQSYSNDDDDDDNNYNSNN